MCVGGGTEFVVTGPQFFLIIGPWEGASPHSTVTPVHFLLMGTGMNNYGINALSNLN